MFSLDRFLVDRLFFLDRSYSSFHFQCLELWLTCRVGSCAGSKYCGPQTSCQVFKSLGDRQVRGLGEEGGLVRRADWVSWCRGHCILPWPMLPPPHPHTHTCTHTFHMALFKHRLLTKENQHSKENPYPCLASPFQEAGSGVRS